MTVSDTITVTVYDTMTIRISDILMTNIFCTSELNLVAVG
jgi:hypothetical protein